jgi:serine protease Do
MKTTPIALAASLFVAAASTVAAQEAPNVDTITFKDGRSVQAPILKETSEKIWIDMGFDVLVVPRTGVASVLRAESGDFDATLQEGDLYSTSQNLPESNPRELAKQIGAAVIKVSTPSGLGSGFIVHKDGFAITNAHVIQGETALKATVFLNSDVEGQFNRVTIDDVEIIAVNNHIDLALVKLTHPDGEEFPIVPIEGGDDLQIGEEVFAIGNPLGLERTLSSGVVATTNRNFEGLAYVQTTAEINPGNSGGPLFNLKGEVVGCTNMGVPSMMADGIGFAIPGRYVRDFIRNRSAFAYDKENPNSGYNYQEPPARRNFEKPSALDDDTAEG